MVSELLGDCASLVALLEPYEPVVLLQGVAAGCWWCVALGLATRDFPAMKAGDDSGGCI